MQKLAITALLLTSLLTGCATTGNAPIPDGSNKEAVNNEAKIQAFTKENEGEVTAHERTNLEKKVDDLSKQVSELKATIASEHKVAKPVKTTKVTKQKIKTRKTKKNHAVEEKTSTVTTTTSQTKKAVTPAVTDKK